MPLPHTLIASGVLGGAPFSPRDIPSLIQWLDGSDISTLFQDNAKTTPVTADGQVVGAWADKSGNGYDVTQATAGNKPLYKAAIKAGRSVIQCVSNDYLVGAFGAPLTQPFTTLVVAKLDAAYVNDNNNRILFDGNDATNRVLIYKDGSTAPDSWGIWADSGVTDGNASANWTLFDALYNGASSQMWVNGASALTGNPGAKVLDGITVGGYYVGSSVMWSGYIAEVLVYDVALTVAQRQQVELYLNNKWSVF